MKRIHRLSPVIMGGGYFDRANCEAYLRTEYGIDKFLEDLTSDREQDA